MFPLVGSQLRRVTITLVKSLDFLGTSNMFHLHESFVQEHVTEKLEKTWIQRGSYPRLGCRLEVERAQIF